MAILTAIWAAFRTTRLVYKIISVVCIITVIVGLPVGLYLTGYNRGWRNCASSRPTNTYNGPTTVVQAIAANVYGLSLGKHWAIGIVHQ